MEPGMVVFGHADGVLVGHIEEFEALLDRAESIAATEAAILEELVRLSHEMLTLAHQQSVRKEMILVPDCEHRCVLQGKGLSLRGMTNVDEHVAHVLAATEQGSRTDSRLRFELPKMPATRPTSAPPR